jgi:hypothetical protein
MQPMGQWSTTFARCGTTLSPISESRRDPNETGSVRSRRCAISTSKVVPTRSRLASVSCDMPTAQREDSHGKGSGSDSDEHGGPGTPNPGCSLTRCRDRENGNVPMAMPPVSKRHPKVVLIGFTRLFSCTGSPTDIYRLFPVLCESRDRE